MSTAQIESYVEQFAYGYSQCTGSDSTTVTTIGVGTNSFGTDVGGAAAQRWVDMIDAVRGWVSQNGYGSQVSVEAADDIETSFNPYAVVGPWVGQLSADGMPYVDYGSAGGCNSPVAFNGGSGGSCNNGWNQDQLWWVSSGVGGAAADPEIYYQGDSSDWAAVCLFGASYEYTDVYFEGVLDEYPLNTGSNTSSQAWSDMWGAANYPYPPMNGQCDQSIAYSTELYLSTANGD